MYHVHRAITIEGGDHVPHKANTHERATTESEGRRNDDGRVHYFVTMPMKALACNYSDGARREKERERELASNRSVDFAKRPTG